MTTEELDRDILWTPPADVRETTQIGRFLAWLEREDGITFDDYEALWSWSVESMNDFWLAVWRYNEIPADAAPDIAVNLPSSDATDFIGTEWFPGARLNYAEAMLRLPGRADDDVVVVGRSQTRAEVTLTAAELRDQVARARAGLVRLGVRRGDRVAAYAPNIPETLVVMLAAASLGAIFSSCAPEFGTRNVIDRWQQIEPKVLVTVDGYRYGDKPIDRRSEAATIAGTLPSLEATVFLPYLDQAASAPSGTLTWAELVSEPAELVFDRVPFDHPLYVLFSSGTTGLPKAIVHGHGGITIEHLKSLGLAMDLGPTDRFFWFSTTGWMMWNLLVSGIGVGATIVMYDGNPAAPDIGALWRMAEETQLTYFGTSAPFLLQCRKEGIVPSDIADLSALRALGSTGAPLPAEGFHWVYAAVDDDLQLASLCGGTDVCTGFLGSNPLVPVYAGRISCRCLGAAVASYDQGAHRVTDQLGELVIEKPMPSMPVGFWGDASRSRYRAAYFEHIPGVWRHGDWITIHADGTSVVTGRSDATLNRGGVRLGTSEFYSVVEALPEVSDSLVVHLEDSEGGAGELVLFVVLALGDEGDEGDEATLDDNLTRKIATELRTHLSPRHVPDAIHQVKAIPRTLSGKKLEVPVKKVLRGASIDDAVAKDALANPDSLDAFVAFAADD